MNFLKKHNIMITKKLNLIIVAITLLFTNLIQSQTISNQWAATDALGRKLMPEKIAGLTRQNKFVGIFYWDWHTEGIAAFDPMGNMTQILAQNPGIELDPNWKNVLPPILWWDEPLFGYYRSTDDWVLRKHAEMLADAGVDAVFFDCTNGTYTWKTAYSKLLPNWTQAQQDGVNAPKIVFMLPFGDIASTTISINEIYKDIYLPQTYKNLWFMWNGKPLIMAYPELEPQPRQTAGLKFTAMAPFTSISASCPSYANNSGNLTFKLFKWNTDYTTSVAATPISSQTFVNYTDNANLVLQFTTQPAGDYLWELCDGTEMVGVWKWTDSTDPVTSYFNGVPVTDGNYSCQILYPPTNYSSLTHGTTHTPVQIFGTGITQARIDSIKNFFTFRPGQPDYVAGPTVGRNDQWGWLENYPQHGYVTKIGGGYEEVTVGVAQNASDDSKGKATGFNTAGTYGRSYTKANGYDTRPDAYLKGLNFQEQWSKAFEIDPDLVFVTGFNEWTAGANPPLSGTFPTYWVWDEYDWERSRDIEPVKSWGNKGDVYYNQLVNNVRKFKGMSASDTVSASKTIDLINLADWNDVKPLYKSYAGNTLHRNSQGQGNTLFYTNTTGRNDIVSAKVARDNSYLYFTVQTANNLTPQTDSKWMRLFIDIDRNKSTGWEGYDFVLNRNSPTDSATIEQSTNAWLWTKVGSASYAINGKTLVLKIKRSILGITDGSSLNLEFKWSDNMQEDGNIMDFYINGDVAPGGRFNYIYKTNWTDDRYLVDEAPIGVNNDIKSELYAGVFDTIPKFNTLKLSQTDYLQTISLPTYTSKNFALNQTGYISVPTKDTYIFTLNTDLLARVYIGGQLVVSSSKTSGQQIGTIQLMPGKHAVKLEYITQAANTQLLDLKMSSSTMPINSIQPTALFKENVTPSVSITFNRPQIYYSPVDSVVIVKAIDLDGSISKVEIYDNNQFISTSNTGSFALKNLNVGTHSMYVMAYDNDGVSTESNFLNFTVKQAFAVPGTIDVLNFMNGKSVTTTTSNDVDGGSSIKVAYGWVEYPINIPVEGTYRITFRVPASSTSKIITLKSNFGTLGTIDVGNTGSSQPWFSVSKDFVLNAGIHNMHLDCASQIIIHHIDFAMGANALETPNALQVNVSPNPSSSDFLVRVRDPQSTLAIYDILGRLVTSMDTKLNSFERRIGQELNPGVYLLVVCSKKGAKQQVKIVKK